MPIPRRRRVNFRNSVARAFAFSAAGIAPLLAGKVGATPLQLRPNTQARQVQLAQARLPIPKAVKPQQSKQPVKTEKPAKKSPKQTPVKKSNVSAARQMTKEQRGQTSEYLKKTYLVKLKDGRIFGKTISASSADFKKLTEINAGNSISWYNRAGKKTLLRRANPKLAFAIEDLATNYRKTFGDPLLCGSAWDYTGHVQGSAHFSGNAIDIDVGPNVGSAEYNNWGKARFRWIADFMGKNHPEFRVIFGESVSKNVIVPQGPKVRQNHFDHMHLDVK